MRTPAKLGCSVWTPPRSSPTSKPSIRSTSAVEDMLVPFEGAIFAAVCALVAETSSTSTRASGVILELEGVEEALAGETVTSTKSTSKKKGTPEDDQETRVDIF